MCSQTVLFTNSLFSCLFTKLPTLTLTPGGRNPDRLPMWLTTSARRVAASLHAQPALLSEGLGGLSMQVCGRESHR